MQATTGFIETLLIVYFLVALNFLFNRLKDFSCHTQTWLTNNIAAKHVFNLAAIFFVIVLFTRSTPIHPLVIIVLTMSMYALFMVITKCDYRFIGAFVAAMTLVFLIESYKNYYKHKYTNTNSTVQEQERHEILHKKLLALQVIIQLISLILIFVGFFVYVGQKSREYPKWKWSVFWLGAVKCKGNSLAKRLKRTVVQDFVDGIKKIV